MEAAEKPKSTQEHVLIAVDSKPKQSPEESHFPVSDEKSQTPRSACRRPLLRSKTKARFVEFNLPTSSSINSSTVSHDRQNPGAGDPDPDNEDRHIEDHEAASDSEEKKRKKRLLTLDTVIQWAAVVVLSAALIVSLTLHSLSHQTLWGLTIWKWCLTLLVVFCGHLFAGWAVAFVVLLIESNFMLREKVLYFIYGIRRGVQNCIWLSFVLLAWMLVFDGDVKASPRYHRILNKITRLLISILVGSFIWLVKIVVVKMLALSFHVSTFFDRMKESVTHQHILDTLSRKPLAEISKEVTKRQEGKRDMESLRQLSKGSPSAWWVQDLVNQVMSGGTFHHIYSRRRGAGRGG